MLNASKITQRNGGNPSKANRDVLVSVSAIVPADGKAMESFVASTLDILNAHYTYYELLLIDNGSPAEVYRRLQELQRRLPNVRVVRLSRSYSAEISLAAALDHCIGDYVVLMDLSQHPPEIIPQLVSAAMDGCDSVTATPAGQRDGLLDRLFCHTAYRLASRLVGFELRSNESTFKVFSRRLVNSIVRIRSKNRYLSYLHASVGLHQSTISYEAATPGSERSGVGMRTPQAAWFGGNPDDRAAFLQRVGGPQAWAYWTMLVCNVALPQLLWRRAVRRNAGALFVLAVLVNVGMWLERFVIVVGSLYQDFLPGNCPINLRALPRPNAC